MGKAALRPCTYPGCSELVKAGRCARHAAKIDRTPRAKTAVRGYDAKWRAYRLSFLRAHPFCVRCMAARRYELATVVDHIIAHRGDQQLMWDPANHQALCERHHNAKSAAERGEGPVRYSQK